MTLYTHNFSYIKTIVPKIEVKILKCWLKYSQDVPKSSIIVIPWSKVDMWGVVIAFLDICLLVHDNWAVKEYLRNRLLAPHQQYDGHSCALIIVFLRLSKSLCQLLHLLTICEVRIHITLQCFITLCSRHNVGIIFDFTKIVWEKNVSN